MTDQIVTSAEDQGIKETLVLGLRFLPQNLLSFLVGGFVRIRWPALIQRPLNKGFVGLFGLNMGEAQMPLREYMSIEDIFTRALLPGQRQIAGAYVSSADGTLEMSRPALAGDEAIQAKGILYSLAELVYGVKSAEINSKWYTTVYLAPHNYHRVHAPFSGRVTGLRYVPGRLWPVNRPAVKAIPGLFCRNERLVFDFELDAGGKGWVVMVGAFNVGRMSTVLKPDFVTNAAKSLFKFSSNPVEMRFDAPRHVNAGDELGVFMLGSTTVVVLDGAAREALKPRELNGPQEVSVGKGL